MVKKISEKEFKARYECYTLKKQNKAKYFVSYATFKQIYPQRLQKQNRINRKIKEAMKVYVQVLIIFGSGFVSFFWLFLKALIVGALGSGSFFIIYWLNQSAGIGYAFIASHAVSGLIWLMMFGRKDETKNTN